MTLSSDEEGVISYRKSTGRKVFDSDEDDESNLNVDETEDFVLRMSEDEDATDNISSKKSVKKKRIVVADSSDDESQNVEEVIAKKHDMDGNENVSQPSASGNVRSETKEKKNNGSDIFDSLFHNSNEKSNDSTAPSQVGERINSPDTGDNNSPSSQQNIMKKLSALADSDSESDIDGDVRNLSDIEIPAKMKTKKQKKGKPAVESESDSDSGPDSDQDPTPIKPMLNSDLYDAEGSSEEDGKEKSLPSHNKTTTNKKSKPRAERKSKSAAKDAMLEIKSESMRQLRHSNVALPYHLPKQRSLTDFLNRRRSSPMPIKGPTEQLYEVWKQISDREKEVEEFYKSESESEDENVDEGGANKSDGEEVSRCAPKDVAENDASANAGDGGVRDLLCENSCADGGIATSGLGDSATDSLNSGNKSPETGVSNLSLLPENGGLNQNAQNVVSSLKPDDSAQSSNVQDVHNHDENMDCQKTNVVDSAEHDSQADVEAACTTSNCDTPKMNKESVTAVNESKKNAAELEKGQTEDFNLCLSEPFSEKIDSNEPKAAEETACAMPATKESSITWEKMQAMMEDIEDEKEPEDPPLKVLLPAAPRLSLKGAPDEVIDLDDISPKQLRTPGVRSLIERFMKHSSLKKPTPSPKTVEINLISSEKDKGGDVVEVKHESMKVVLTGEEEPRPELQKPGARLKLLKDELNRQMRRQKEEEWQRKQEEMKSEKVFDGEKDECGMNVDEDEEEEEMTDSDTESEPEINDVREPKRMKKVNKAFMDEEAEVEDDDGEGDEESEAEDSEEDNAEVENDSEENAEDSDVETKGAAVTTKPRLERSLTSTDLFASQDCTTQTSSNVWDDDEEDDDLIPAGQRIRETQLSKNLETSNNSATAGCKTTPRKFPWASLSNSQNDSDVPPTQDSIDDLLGLCSGNATPDEISKLANVQGTPESDMDLMALCSGKFVTQPLRPQDLEHDDTSFSGLPDTQDMDPSQASTLPVEDSQPATLPVEDSQPATLPVEDSQDFILKWNDDDKGAKMQNFGTSKKKLEMELMSSDDEEAASVPVEKKKKNRKLAFSDDEDDGDNSDKNSASDGLSDFEDCGDEDSKLTGEEISQKPAREIMYDSDENEIEPTAFFEREAELSEEDEWNGSDDEDEVGLDQLEMNEADKEDIDQDQVREQLVKNHMQKMLDEDRRDVRILQEMLLEDGELHSEEGGRERQFRWRNVDSQGMSNDLRNSDEENADGDEEEEDDAEWRRQRHEREMFLKEQREKQEKQQGTQEENDEVLENSELLQLGKTILHKSRTSFAETTPPVAKPAVQNLLTSPDGKRPHQLFTKRGSFLSRSDGILAKLAKITGPAKENISGRAKNSGNFVFAAISPEKKEHPISKEDNETKAVKRKASFGLSNPADKKQCLITSTRKGKGLFDHL